MINFFRSIRHKLADENQFLKYSRYAIGEIILVVIGILIALQINNQNEERKTRTKELVYLRNIKADFELNKASIEEFMKAREDCIESSEVLIDLFEGKRELNLNEFNYHAIMVMVWFPFHPQDNTYQELMNSGNLALISNKSIKDGLQNMQSSFKAIAFIEGEMQQDYESYLYDIYFSIADLNASMENFDQQISNEIGRSTIDLSMSEVENLLQNRAFKNGIVLAKYNSGLLIEEYKKIISNTTKLRQLIDNEFETKP